MYAIGQSFIVVNGQTWKHNLPIWSHCRNEQQQQQEISERTTLKSVQTKNLQFRKFFLSALATKNIHNCSPVVLVCRRRLSKLFFDARRCNDLAAECIIVEGPWAWLAKRGHRLSPRSWKLCQQSLKVSRQHSRPRSMLLACRQCDQMARLFTTTKIYP